MAINNWTSLLIKLGMHAEDALQTVSSRANRRLQPGRPLHVIAYRGFGNRQKASLRGRVLYYNEPLELKASELWNNLRASYARFDTDEVANVQVSGLLGNLSANTLSDEEGYFELTFMADDASASEIGHASQSSGAFFDVTLTLPQHGDFQLDGNPQVLFPGKHARYGVISDIDDTLLKTEASSLLRMMRLTLLESSESRVAFAGVAEFYEALHNQHNPFFYVSSSPWNLYEFLTDFMALKNIVAGPLMLRDFGIDETKFIAGPHKDHKLQQIRKVLDCYPDMGFILSGDSGQDDPEIYAQIVREYPDRIKSIYIRDVGGDWRRSEVRALAQSLVQYEVDLVLAPDSLAAAQHAAAQGYFDAAVLNNIGSAVVQDQAPHRAHDEQSTRP